MSKTLATSDAKKRCVCKGISHYQLVPRRNKGYLSGMPAHMRAVIEAPNMRRFVIGHCDYMLAIRSYASQVYLFAVAFECANLQAVSNKATRPNRRVCIQNAQAIAAKHTVDIPNWLQGGVNSKCQEDWVGTK
eukprot:6200173-Pleurochrysis_carterae.AAC.1